MADIHELPELEGVRLTMRQRRVLEVIRNSVDRRGYPPSPRESGDAGGLASPPSGGAMRVCAPLCSSIAITPATAPP